MSNTRVLALMFHRVNEVSLGHHPLQFAEYLNYLVKNFPIVSPGESLPKVPLAILLTFDDAYYDFYHHVYPLLVKYQVKALLAIPVKYIVNSTSLPRETRLSVPYAHDMENPIFSKKVPFCTWDEITEMASSGHVVIASHGYQHANLEEKSTDFHQEIIVSKEILEKKLNQSIKYFVYPFGRMTASVHQKVCQNYDFGIRIGSALNLGWDHHHHFIYRINADPLWTKNKPIDPALIRKLTLKYWINRIRLK